MNKMKLQGMVCQMGCVLGASGCMALPGVPPFFPALCCSPAVPAPSHGAGWCGGLVSERGLIISVSCVDPASAVPHGWSALAECWVLSRGLPRVIPFAHYLGGGHPTLQTSELRLSSLSSLVPRWFC